MIADSGTGKLYVGAAYGVGGIWQRWMNYAQTRHGGNVQLRPLVDADEQGAESSFKFAVLEIADLKAGDVDIHAREEHWKRVLQTRPHGLN